MMAYGEHIDQPASNWTIQVSDVRTIKVSNISMATSVKDIRDFFSFSGRIHYVEMLRESERTQVSYVTFEESKGADTAMLLTGAYIGDHSVTITPVENYQLPPQALPLEPENSTPAAVKKAGDVVSTMLAKGFILGKDAISRAKSFDERHCLTSNASATVASIDHKIGLRDKLSIGRTVLNDIVREMDEKLLVSKTTKSAFTAAEEKVSSAGSAIMSNQYMLTGASWLSGAYNMVANAVGNVSMKTREKVEQAELEKGDITFKENAGFINDFGRMHYEASSAGGLPVYSVYSDKVDV